MSDGRKGRVLLIVAVLAVAVAARLTTLHWTPLPSTLDGFGYVALARDTLETGTFPLTRFRADNIVFTAVLTVVGALTGERPLYIAQPVVAVTGAASCLTAMALVKRLAQSSRWAHSRTTLAMGVVGMGLAVEGVYLRRTGQTDEEALAFLLLPLFAIAVHRLLTMERYRRRWGAVAVVLFAAFPLLHTFSSLIAALVLTGVLAAHLARIPSRRDAVTALVVVAGFWVYMWGYYRIAERSLLEVPYVDRVSAYPGLFLAWVVVLVATLIWFQRTSARLQRVTIGGAVGLWFLTLGSNAVQTVFPGTQTTPTGLLLLVAAFAVPMVFAVVGLPRASRDRRLIGPVVLALLLAPIVIVYFSLTASLTPEYYGTALRGQTFVHLPVFVLAGIGVASVAYRRSPSPAEGLGTLRTHSHRLATVLTVVVVVAALATMPIAFVNLDTLAFPTGATESQFAAATFTAEHVDEQWVSDHPFSRIVALYYPGAASGTYQPTARWLGGGTKPNCPTLSRASWGTTGAHLFPAGSEKTTPAVLEEWRYENNVVYDTRGLDSVYLVRPGGNRTSC
ncbi:sodium:phosphate symporter [Haloarcula sp. CBA1130]|uniref:sodium:phosphate symporter n=1 Tax=unclassified Haloarcula TaxID=2624677 RepID=UPI001246A1AB|nr:MULTISPECIES: sodium:phosphate symporter [unclassified Haloarcula]KAA9397845.1 sodium:phosphate symporter [Haloarcula sp. CBA1129]KAA9402466.1 sodium:phosphate symporter [Haloarcula sp. CBA1130]